MKHDLPLFISRRQMQLSTIGFRGVARRPNLRQQCKERQVVENETSSSDLSDVEEIQDFWEGEKWEWIGTVGQYFVPLVVLLAVIVGGIAAYTYNEGASVFLKPSNPNQSAQLLQMETGQ
eukprot:TRINITY_DN8856_c0_g1_i3.p2 TRINITY_DN8856_c0_g1~~TRINITY_DN8856_c0_g1_i3.p2  ORF type:complete len:120 (+),score=10.81 TRINITY_DN8856_c0_g1_i3:156-515(+)